MPDHCQIDQAAMPFDGLGAWPLDSDEARVMTVLGAHRGRARAVQGEVLAAQVGISSRELQHVVHRLRIEHGAPIASSAGIPRGYYLVETAEELESCYREHRAKALGTLAAMAALRRTSLAELLGQLALEVTP